jgi:aldehyde:ferredoxin oxidoreductase
MISSIVFFLLLDSLFAKSQSTTTHIQNEANLEFKLYAYGKGIAGQRMFAADGENHQPFSKDNYLIFHQA